MKSLKVNFLKRLVFSSEGAEREGERGPQAGSMASAEPDARLDPTNREIVTRAEIKSRTFNRLSHPRAPESNCLQQLEEAGPWRLRSI